MTDDQKRSPDDPRYKMPGTPFINLSAWSRENVPKPDHGFKVGDVVVLTVTCEIVALTRDCDGTALYKLSDSLGNGWSEEQLRAATDDEIENY